MDKIPVKVRINIPIGCEDTTFQDVKKLVSEIEKEYSGNYTLSIYLDFTFEK